MKCKPKRILILIVFFSILNFSSNAFEYTGIIKGRVLSDEGNPVEKAIVYLDSPELMALRFFVTPSSGRMSFDRLPGGTYTARVEIPGYKSVVVENIILRQGETVKIDITLSRSDTEGEIERREHRSIPDAQNPNISYRIEEVHLTKLPVRRHLVDIVNIAPGVFQDDTFYPQTQIFKGTTARANLYTVDGLSLNDPLGDYLIGFFPYDAVSGIEVKTGGNAVSSGSQEGGHVNILSKSGSNSFYYSLSAQHGNSGLTGKLGSEEEADRLGIQPPVHDKSLWDLSFSLSGALWPDRGWFFGNFRWFNDTKTTPFTPWQDPQGKTHDSYEWQDDTKTLFTKVTTHPYANFRLGASFLYINRTQNNSLSSLDWNLTSDAVSLLDHEKHIIGGGFLSYRFSQNTSAFVNTGYIDGKSPIMTKDSQKSSMIYTDELLGYRWGSPGMNDLSRRKRFFAHASIHHFFNLSPSFDSEVNFGAEYEFSYVEHNIWQEQGITLHYLDGDPYFFGQMLSPQSDREVGTGKISLNFASTFQNGYIPSNEIRRIGFFVHDSFTISDRFTLSLGLRFDRSIGTQKSFTKAAAGSEIAQKIGTELIEPVTGVNPYTDIIIPDWKNTIVWNTLSPRAGFAVDLFGKGTTLIKGTWARYIDPMGLQLLETLSPFNFNKSHDYFWYDENQDGLIDTQDSFGLNPDDFFLYDQDNYQKRLVDGIKAPVTQEFTLSLEQELFRDVVLSVSLFQNETSNLIENVLIDRESGAPWYSLDQDSQDWWIPFDTIVPGAGDFPDTPVTVYFPSEDSPLFFDQVRNVPELKRKYRGIEFSLSKRMAHGWMLDGSILIGRSRGNANLGFGASSGLTSAAYTPNYFVNFPDNALLDYDRPLVVKLTGAVRLPWDFMLSGFFRHASGRTWARSVTVAPPQDWTETQGARRMYMQVLLEEHGSRRLEPMNILDCRLEKTIKTSTRGKIVLALDVLNLLGDKLQTIQENDGGIWLPSAERSTQGTRLISPRFNQVVSLKGVRSFRLSFRLGF